MFSSSTPLPAATRACTVPGAVFASATSIGDRAAMEDEHILYSSLHGGRVLLCAVFDGHAGHGVAFFMRTSFSNALTTSRHWDLYVLGGGTAEEEVAHLRSALEDTIVACDQHVLAHMDTSSGSTAVVVLITETHVVTANVGDSRACALRSVPVAASTSTLRPVLDHLTRDHKPCIPSETERIVRAGGRVDRTNNRVEVMVQAVATAAPRRILYFPYSLAMSRALGDRVFKSNPRLSAHEQCVVCTPEVSVVPRAGIRFLLVASDGVWDAFPPEKGGSAAAMHEMATIVAIAAARGGGASDETIAVNAVEEFVRYCVACTTPAADNATAILVMFGTTT